MGDPAVEEGLAVKKSDSRRSPTTGHRKRKQDLKRSHSLDVRRGSGKLTSSEEELIDKCHEMIEEAKTLRRRSRSKVHEKQDLRLDDAEQPTKDKLENSEVSVPWWKAWFTKKAKKDEEEEKQPLVEKKTEVPKPPRKVIPTEPLNLRELFTEGRAEFKKFKKQYAHELVRIKKLRNRCMCELLLVFIYCGMGGFIFKTTEGTFELFYKCGVKRVKRDFIDELWRGSHNMREDEWKSKARRKLMEFENQLHEALEAGMTTYSGQRSWSFINAVIYSLTVITTIGYGHIAPVTTTGRALTIVYSIVGIPIFLILLADFGKLFTRGIKFIWAFVRRFYYTGTCKKVRRTAPVQPTEEIEFEVEETPDTEEVMKGVQIMYDLAHLRRPSQVPPGEEGGIVPTGSPADYPPTPALSTFAVDDEFNLPVTVAFFILLIYIFLGALVFWMWEDWTFFEAFYFVFISMSTIGFGDLVPQNQMYMMASIVYLAFGLALTSMCINVVQEKLSDTFRKAGAKIGATIGLKVAEDDGTVSPVSPTHVEISEVHGMRPAQTAQSL